MRASVSGLDTYRTTPCTKAAGVTIGIWRNGLSASRSPSPVTMRSVRAVHLINHTFRATGITAYLKNKGTLEHAQTLANHASPRATKLYDRRSDEISLDEVEKIRI